MGLITDLRKKSSGKERLTWREVKDKGDFLQDYPTDSWGGSNTGDAEMYKLKGKYYEIDKHRDSNRVKLVKVPEELGRAVEKRRR